jgi:hypothetical protein
VGPHDRERGREKGVTDRTSRSGRRRHRLVPLDRENRGGEGTAVRQGHHHSVGTREGGSTSQEQVTPVTLSPNAGVEVVDRAWEDNPRPLVMVWVTGVTVVAVAACWGNHGSTVR